MLTSRHRNILTILNVLILSLSVGTADTTTDLVSHWMLDEGAGVVAVDSVGGNDGVLQGDATWAEGYFGTAVLLDGTGDYIDCGSKAAFNITDKVSLAAWVQAKGDFAYPDWSGIIMRGGPNIDTFALYYHKATLRFGFKTTGTNPNWFASANGAATPLFDGDWHHVAATYDGTMKRIYLDGVEIGRVASTGKIETSTNRLLLGAGRDTNPPTHYVAGRIDDARLYKRALSPADVKELVPPKLQAYQPTPTDGALGVMMPLFSWKPGETAAFHKVYLGTDPNLGPNDLVAPALGATMYFHLTPLDPGATYYWRVDEVERDTTTTHMGNVWSFTTQGLTAYHPQPADGAVDASPIPALTWMAGQMAIQHHVYFSAGFADVNTAAPDADKGLLPLAEATFAPGELESLTTYYWRVDEVLGDGVVRPGPVWSFATFLSVDDFESYTNEVGQRVFQTWLDGIGYTEPVETPGNGTGALVGYDPAAGDIMEKTIVHGGTQSMPMDYNNVEPPFYSQAERTFAPPVDWTVNDANTLVLFVRGRLSNAAAPLYVAIEDTFGRLGVATHPDPAVLTLSKWTEWRIALADLATAGMNPAAVRKMYIGVGDRNAPSADGAGTLFLDDIRLIRAAQ